MQNPALGERFVASLFNTGLGLEVFTELAEDKLSGLVDLVTELTVAVNDLDVESNITSCKSSLVNRIKRRHETSRTTSGVRDKGEAESIGTTLGDTLGEGLLLVPGSSGNLLISDVA